jgi:hypothetical protein
VLESESCIAALAEPDLHTLEAGRHPLLRLLDHLWDRRVVCVAGGDRGQPLVDGAAEEVEDAAPEHLPPQVPERDVDRRDGVRVDPASVAVPPAPGLVFPPEASVCTGSSPISIGASPSMSAFTAKLASGTV